MCTVKTLARLLSLLVVAVHHAAASCTPPILYPNASSIWYKDYLHNVTWDITKLPADTGIPIIRLYKNGQDTAEILATNFDLTVGRVEVTVPWVMNGTDYQIRMFFNGSSPVEGTANDTTVPVTTSSSGDMDCGMPSSSVTATGSMAPENSASTATSGSSAASVSSITSSVSSTSLATSSASTSTMPEVRRRMQSDAVDSTMTSTSTDSTTDTAAAPATTSTSSSTLTSTPVTDSSASATAADTDTDCDGTSMGVVDTTASTSTDGPTSSTTTVDTTSSATTDTTTTTGTATSSSTGAAPSASDNSTRSSDDSVTCFESSTFTILERPNIQNATGSNPSSMNSTLTDGASSTPQQGMRKRSRVSKE
ncbi:hypothetical protein BD309DRAFT_1063173 [Dichomitus squalens]|uniref:Uncharacterized protein n=1 Tax=Dichomitus squalens TaxID=114155 RepID=A0A4Q9P1Q6_9APHY|nr:uncharacterized protein DICSQDRAFT_165980 [Dichomitus squalens LYAD-421 SS1]EJF66279.1 hypothetical protein DICSQDRAFT_165980 [Dichomitus squalens LYAD-421 SS1]TBU46461.1 hypothetical protein BD309DRAFT_1063173 [Dichomitus squalens]TBU65316.1 hypothetical protein BD310DRAFT_863854 [Dichomitus squalens]